MQAAMILFFQLEIGIGFSFLLEIKVNKGIVAGACGDDQAQHKQGGRADGFDDWQRRMAFYSALEPWIEGQGQQERRYEYGPAAAQILPEEGIYKAAGGGIQHDGYIGSSGRNIR